MKLLGLLVFLFLGLWVAADQWGGQSAPARQGLAADLVAPEPAPEPKVLPATVARLVRNTETLEPTEVVTRSNARGPVVIPLPAVAARPVIADVTAVAVTPEPALMVQRITATSANVRGGPSIGNPVVGRLTRGEEVEVLETANGWARIRLQGDGVEGWVSTKLLSN
jgi:hypothetical protein